MARKKRKSVASLAFAYGVGRHLTEPPQVSERDCVRFNYLGTAAQPSPTRYLDPDELPVERVHRYTLKPSPSLVIDVVMSMEQERLRAAAVARPDVGPEYLAALMGEFFDILRS